MPTLEAFAPRFLDGYARANRQKASGVAAKEMIVRVHLAPALGGRRLAAKAGPPTRGGAPPQA